MAISVLKIKNTWKIGVYQSLVKILPFRTFPIQHQQLLGQPTALTHPHLMQPNEITPGITLNEYKERRKNLVKVMKNTHFGKSHDKHLLIFSSNPTYFMGPDVPYHFRQNSNFLYLTGYQEPDSVLIIEIGMNNVSGDDYRTIFFTRPRDKTREIWDGPRNGLEGATEHFGFQEAYPIDEISQVILKRFSDKDCHIWYDHMQPSHLHINKDIMDVLLNSSEFHLKKLHAVGHIVESLRVVKSPAEISIMKKCANITAHGFMKTMSHTKPDVQESQLQNVMEYECKKLGANRLSFPPVVAGGQMANTLHYVNNDQLLRNGDLLLVDSGCELNGYSSDVTRVWPVDGSYTKPQKELYDILLNIQKNCIKLCKVGTSIDKLYQTMIGMMIHKFEAIKLIPKDLPQHHKHQLVRQLCPHNIGHYLGMDVHDVCSMSKNLPLDEGMVITIEPGVYVRNDMDVPTRYKGIGIRIEDDILITKEGPEVLTSLCPKETDEIESYIGMARKKC
ncbi:xaa-Pro aminopeptidase 3-like [Xenia sp. Carnegie-2017]|uniref:xaa-Pro aminopeptidase 3-like n=1 Tax=Xenia sp. Carnegie-2017 TaxID=2897299 RepID=UPI001F0426B1|nr:xaa-Pro aminopeptidase 3-like [Xenia sp. Carnegie-2017]